MSICKAPFVGMTINPQGELELCCNVFNAGETLKTNINDIDDLEEFFWSNNFQKIRDQFESDGWENNPACRNCVKQKNKGLWINAEYYDDHFTKDYLEYKNDLRIRFLEFTPSNICNQSCSTCSSYFSTTRGKVEKTLFGFKDFDTFKLDGKNIDKIKKIVPKLDHIMIKGGEPFADRTNYYILKELIGTNPSCGVHIVSNMHSIPEEFLSLISDLSMQGNDFFLSASIDGIGDLYEWIRGTKFDDTCKTMKEFYLASGRQIDINVCVSMYNILRLNDIKKFFASGLWYDITNNIDMSNHVINPDYAIPNFETLSRERKEYAIKYIEMMDKVRGIRLFDIQPELEEKLRGH